MRNTKYESGFTLAELLMALVVTSIILVAVATLAYAVWAANDVGDDTTQKQAQVRYATLRISELIRHSKLVCKEFVNTMAIWRADDNGDGRINMAELVYIGRGPARKTLRLIEFTGNNPVINLAQIEQINTNWWLVLGCERKNTGLIPQCSNVQFVLDAAPPQTKFVGISFELSENGIVHQYQICASLRAWAGHLLDGSGNLVSVDDDEG